MRRPTWAQSVFKQISGISSKVWECCETGEQISPVPSCPGWELTRCWVQMPARGVPGVPESCHCPGGVLGSRIDPASTAGVMDWHRALQGRIASRITAGTFRLRDAAPKGTGHHSNGGAAAGWPPQAAPSAARLPLGPHPLQSFLSFFHDFACLPPPSRK